MPHAAPQSLVIADYDPRWPDMYEEERACIQRAIGKWLADLQHCGSTAVPGLAAKPVIDIYAGLRSWADREHCIAPLEALGYEYRGENAGPGAVIFVKLTDRPLPGQIYRARDGKIRARSHNLHVMPRTHPEWDRHVLFRDYLRQDKSVAGRYAELKRELAEKYPTDIDAYTKAKSEFIEIVIGRARAGPPIPVRIVDYDPHWPAMFEDERKRIVEATGQWLIAIEHLGSTSVPGLAAKPVIDMVAAVATLNDAKHIIEPLAALGYDYVPEYEVELPERRYFRKRWRGPEGDKYHLHVVELGSEFWQRHLAFRDYLRRHPEAVREYAELKRRLAIKHGTDIDAYTEAKSDFIRGIEQKAAAAAPSPSSSSAKRGAPATQ
jgi:GrpB-like predicted nucleotidyltransferase (UPF0157 family)